MLLAAGNKKIEKRKRIELMKTLVEKEESKKPEEEGKDPSEWKNSGEIDTYKLMVLLNNLIRSGKLNLIALNEDVFKNVAYDFDINERDGSISKDDELYKTAKSCLMFQPISVWLYKRQ